MATSDIYARTVDEDVQQNDHNTCPECGGRVTTNCRETVCDDCGLVIADERIDRGPEWRDDGDDRSMPRRAGSPTTVARHDRGIGSSIGWKRDGYGRELDGSKRLHMARLRRRNRRAKIGSKTARNQVAGLTEIRRMAGALGLADSVRDQACQLFRTAHEEGLLQGRSIESVAAACLYAVCRLTEQPRPIDDIGSLSAVAEDRVTVAYTALNRELDLPVPPTTPSQYVPQIVSGVDASRETEQGARELLADADAQAVANGQNPTGTAAGAVYLAAQRTGELVTQEAVANEAGVSMATVRKRVRDLQAEAT